MSLTAALFHAHMMRLSRSTRPILIGPWRSEVGFETLYWLPFLRKALTRYGIKPERLVTVTRGGAGVLYGVPSVDLYRLRTVEQVRLENAYDQQRTGLQKQMDVTSWDRTVLREAAALHLGRGVRYHTLHPSWMYRLLTPWWENQAGSVFLDRWTDYTPIAPLTRPPIAGLPQAYIAMKWYDRATWPVGDKGVQQWMGEVCGMVGSQLPIVMLTGTTAADDHCDVEVRHPNIVTPEPAPPERNLEQQLRILSHAQAFVGTYGGMAQAALRLGVPSVSFWHQFGGTALAHLHLSDALAKKTGVPFLASSVGDAVSLRKVIGLPPQPQIHQPANTSTSQ